MKPAEIDNKDIKAREAAEILSEKQEIRKNLDVKLKLTTKSIQKFRKNIEKFLIFSM